MTPELSSYLEIRAAAPSGWSDDDATVLVSANLGGSAQLYALPREGGDLRQLTDFDEPVGGRFLPGSDDLLVTIDVGGNERTQLHRLTRRGELRPVVVEPDNIARAGGVSRDGSLLAYTSNRRTGADFDVYVRDLGSGEERMVFSPGGWCSAGAFSPDRLWLGVTRLSEKPADNDLYLVQVATGEVVHVSPHEGESSYGGPSWLPDSSAFFFSTDEGREFSAVARYDLATRSWAVVVERDWDTGGAVDWSGRTLLVATNADGTTKVELLDPGTLELRAELPLPGAGVAGGFSFSHDGRSLAYAYSSAREPGDVWRYDLETGETTRLTDVPKGVPAGSMVDAELHRFDSFDGVSIPAFAYRPVSPPVDPPPVVVVIHGGPESQFVPAFNPVIQYLVARGYAVVAPNVRGSTGYGKVFEHLDDVERRLDSVRDLAALSAWLRTSGVGDPDRAVLYGGSYGGYMVLAGLAFQPERWAAGVCIVGISSLVTFLQNTAEWRRRFREREYGSLEHHLALLEAASPLNRVDDIRSPLFLIHGANDPRVPLGEAEQIHASLRERGVRCELAVYHDEGHGLAKLVNRLDAYPRAVDFLDEVLATTSA